MAWNLLVVSALLLVPLTFLYVRSWSATPLPPGPQGRFPLLGMTFDMPVEKPWLTLTNWTRKYGPIVHYRIGLQHFIMIGSGAIQRDILVRKASLYSSRPPSKVGEILSGSSRCVLLPYGERWRRMRRVFTNVLTAKKCDSYAHVQETEAIRSLVALRDHPDEWKSEVHRYTLSVARTIAFGQQVETRDEPFAKDVSQYMHQFAKAMTPGKYLFESIPALQLLPRFMQPWMDELQAFRQFEFSFCLKNYRAALDWATQHPERPCIANDVQREMKALGINDEQQAACTCMEILGTGSETTAYSLMWFVMACLMNPECVKKAHEELDRVVGRDRYPTWEDEPRLPYIRAMIKEQHRWRTIAPMSFPHYAEEEDNYQGYRIPKGSVIRINTWAMHMDADRYPEPDRYIPERFLQHSLSSSAYANSSDVAARDHFSFGDGKRICVGIHLAERSMFNLVSHLLQTFDIVRAKDSNGDLIPVDPSAANSSLVMSPVAFPADFKVRNLQIGGLLQRSYDERF